MSAHVDARGVIQDLVPGITRITTAKGAVRGNHVHKRTTQWTVVITGSLLVADSDGQRIVGAGGVAVHKPGDPHAWEALEDTDCIVFTQGPRAEDYASDTFPLDTPLL